ncbi:hypothetical protein NX059_006362 [Plenodomus lindquistii]|nr:hypothetical protein NX059_006362 [Plenodomus lindquistii]
MLLRSSSSTKEPTFDSGYRSDQVTPYEHDSVRQVHQCSCNKDSNKEHICVAEPTFSSEVAHRTRSSGLYYDKTTLGDTPKLHAHRTIEEQSGSDEDAEVCETDSEDEISQQFEFPYKNAEDFPVVPLPSTLARAGYHTAAIKIEKLYSQGREKAQGRQQVGTSSNLGHNGRSQHGATNNRASAGVLVSKPRVQYSFEEALEATEGLREFSDGDAEESENEYV